MGSTMRAIAMVKWACGAGAIAALLIVGVVLLRPVQGDSAETIFGTPQDLTRLHILELRARIDSFRAHNGRYPENLDPIVPPPREGLLNFRSDGWMRPLIYSRDGDHYELRSSGADGLPGSADDMIISDSDSTAIP